MDHLVLQWGGALLTTRRNLPGFWYSTQRRDRQRLPMPTLLLDDSLQQSAASGNYSASLGPPARPTGITSLRYLENKIRADSEIKRFWHHLGNIIGDIDDVSSSLYYRYFDSENTPIEPVLYQQWEQLPNPDSRIQLSAESDSLGMPRVRLNWSLNQLDHHTLLTGQHALAREVGRLGIGRLRIDIDAQQAIPDTVEGDNHQLGTTRMHQSPRHGVVNENCRVHSVDNLFIAGGSVFPTGGSSNPTLTVVALALRLADHLKEQLA